MATNRVIQSLSAATQQLSQLKGSNLLEDLDESRDLLAHAVALVKLSEGADTMLKAVQLADERRKEAQTLLEEAKKRNQLVDELQKEIDKLEKLC